MHLRAGPLTPSYSHPSSREEKIHKFAQIPHKTPQNPRDLWSFIFTHLSLAHSEFTPCYLSLNPLRIPVLSNKNPQKILSRPFFLILARKNLNFKQIFVDFSGYLDFLWTFLALERYSGRKLDLFFLLYSLYPILIYLSLYFIFQQYTKIKTRFLLNSLILPQKILFYLNPAKISSKIILIMALILYFFCSAPNF